MRREHIPDGLRRMVIERAGSRCEYCLIHQDDVPFSHHVDHLVALKHGGRTESNNLALACLKCNRYKGSDLGAIDPGSGKVTALFNPRSQIWAEHFMHEGARIIGKTAVGRATITLLRLNDTTRLIERRVLIDGRQYPPRTP